MSTCLLDARRTWRTAAHSPRQHSPDPDPPVDWVVPLFVERAIGEPTTGRRLLTSDLLPTADFLDLAHRAPSCRHRFLQWVEEGSAGALGHHHPLAMFLGDDLLHAWREILYGQACAEALAEHGDIQRLLWRPGTSGGGAATAELFFQSLVGGLAGRLPCRRLAGSITSPRQGWQRRLDNAYRKVRNRLEQSWGRPPRSGRCLAVFSTNQWQRFTSALDDLRDAFGEELSLWHLGRLDPSLVEAMRKRRIPVSQLPLPPRVDVDIATFFEGRYRQWNEHGRYQLAEDMACPNVASPELESFFAGYFTFTFPRACQWLRDIESAFAACRPEVVIGSAAYTFTSALPLIAAEGQNIPSVALSHTYISGDHSPVPSRFLACRNAFERQGFAESFADDGAVFHCRNASDDLSYQVTASTPPIGLAGGMRRIALLTASPQFQSHAMPIHEIGPWIETIEALCEPPEDLEDVQWIFKFHPRYDLTQHVERRGRADNVLICPATASLHEVLSDCWLAVLVNHIGGVGIDARLADVPIAFLDAAHFCNPFVDPDSLQAIRLQSHHELWQLVRDLTDEPSRYAELQRANQEFVAQRLTSANASLSQCLTAAMPGIIGPR